MNIYQANSSFNPSILQRRPSLFKTKFEDDKFLNKSVQTFILLNKQQNPWESNASITWERLSSGYRIIDLQINRIEEILELLKSFYFRSDQTILATNLYINSHTIKSYQQFILDNISDGNSFCAIEEGTGKIIGVAVASVNFAFDESVENNNFAPNEDVFNVLKFKNNLMYEANIFENFSVNEYFCIHIFCVIPDYHGNGIGTSLIRSCLTRAEKKHYPLCIGIFPSGSSYTIAQKFGFKTLSEMLWMYIKSSNTSPRRSSLNFDTVENNFVTCMGLLIPLDEEIITSSDKKIC